jgi:cell division protein FtsA
MSTILSARPSRTAPARQRGRGTPVTVLDIGSSKICCYIARPVGNGGFAVLGRGYQIADGIKSGEVIDSEAVEGSIRAVLHEAEEQAGETVREVVAVVGAGRPRSLHIRVARPLGGRAVRSDDIRVALARVREELADPEFTVLHLTPVEMAVDESRGLRDPRGMAGNQLDLLVHAVVAQSKPLRNLVACLERCHVDVAALVAAPLAAGMGAASEEELEHGCLVLDIGAGTTQLAHFAQGRLACLDRIDKGGDRVVGDIAYGLSTTRRAAERIMNLHGSVVWRASDDGVRIPVPLLGDRDDEPSGEAPRTRLTFIIRARVEDILKEVAGRLRQAREVLVAAPPRSLVITGGAAQIDGMEELAEEVFRIPVRVGAPMGLADSAAESPCCAAAIGGLLLRTGLPGPGNWWDAEEQPTVTYGIARLKEWLRQNF